MAAGAAAIRSGAYSQEGLGKTKGGDCLAYPPKIG